MKNALSTLLPLMLFCVGSVLLNLVAVWVVEMPFVHAPAGLARQATAVLREQAH